MIPMTMYNLERTFNMAIDSNQLFVAVRIEMVGFPEDEIIINHINNAESKLGYYKKTYDEDLNHKHAKGIKIVGFTFGKSMSEIQEDLY